MRALKRAQTARADEDRFLKIMYARLPEDKWVGVATHHLNALWGEEGKGDKQVSKWLMTTGRRYVVDGRDNTYSLFSVKKRVLLSPGNAVLDTWLCFAGIDETVNVLNRKQPTDEDPIVFKVIDALDVRELALSPDDSDQQRILRRVQRKLAQKKAALQPSPARPDEPRVVSASATPAGAASADMVAVSPDDGEPWAHLSRAELWASCAEHEQRADKLEAARDSAVAAQRSAEAARDSAIDAQRSAEVALESARTEHVRDVQQLRTALEDVERMRAAAAAELEQIRGRESGIVKRLEIARRASMQQLNEMQQLRREPLAVRVSELEKLAEKRDAVVLEAKKELAQAQTFKELDALAEPAGPDMLYVSLERKKKDAALREVIRPRWALKQRLSALSEMAKFWFGLGWLWALAYILSQHRDGIEAFLSFQRPRAFVQKMIDRGVKTYEGSHANADRAFLTKLTTIVGRKRWEKMRRALKYVAETYYKSNKKMYRYKRRVCKAGLFTIALIDDMCSRSKLDAARKRLVHRYSQVWEAEFGAIERLSGVDKDGNVIEAGAYVDVFGVAMTCIKSGLEFQEYHDHVHFVVRYDEYGPYLYTLIGDGCDEYPRNRRHTATEGSLSNRLEFGAACSSPRQFPYLSVDSKETGAPTVYALKKKEAAVTRLRKTLEPANRHTITVTLPDRPNPVLSAFLPTASHPSAQRAPSCPSAPPSLSGATVKIRCAVDYVPLFDLKHHAFCNKNAGTAALYGGIMYSVDRDHLCLPEARLLSYVDFMKDEKTNRQQHYFVHTKEYIKKCVDECAEHMRIWKAAYPEGDWEKEAQDFATSQRHSWWKCEMPYEFMSLAFFCVLHLDTNLGAVWIEMYNAYALQLAEHRGISYDDVRSPLRQFHEALEKCDMEPIARRFRNRLPPQQDPQDFRLLGPHVLSAMTNVHLFDAACRVDDETDAEWLERTSIKTMALMHRGISSLHSQFTMKRSQVPLLVDMGRYMMRLVDSLHLPRSYNLNYMCIGNPQLLELHVERYVLMDGLVMGLQSLGCTQVSCVCYDVLMMSC